MNDINQLIDKYTKAEKRPTLDDLYDLLSINGSSEEKEILTDAYISDFCICHSDYMCGKFNRLDWIWDLMNNLEKIKNLKADFDNYHYFKANVYEMLSTVNEVKEEKIKYMNLCLDHFRKQKETEANDVTLLIDLSENLFRYCELIQSFDIAYVGEIKTLLLQALHLERKEEHQLNFYAFNGSAISAFLSIAYRFLDKSIPAHQKIHQEYLEAFSQAIQVYVEKDPTIYYHWAETLQRIIQGASHSRSNYKGITEVVIDQIWEKIKELMNFLTEVTSNDEHFLNAVGNLFTTIAKKEESYFYLQTAYNYYAKNLELNDQTWYYPTYASDSLRMMAFFKWKEDKPEEAVELFKKGLVIFEEAQSKINDFQLSLEHADYLFDYSKYVENFSNAETLLTAQKWYKDSLILGEDFYTSPYYGVAKIALYLGEKEECLEILKKCGTVFTHQYHTHDFSEIVDSKDFEQVRTEILKIVSDLKKINEQTES